jgi:hypothetical protein
MVQQQSELVQQELQTARDTVRHVLGMAWLSSTWHAVQHCTTERWLPRLLVLWCMLTGLL